MLGMLKASPAVMGVLGASPPLASECGHSAVTRMELLGFLGITPESRGWLWLLDDRDRRPAVRRLLPAWWAVELTGDERAG